MSEVKESPAGLLVTVDPHLLELVGVETGLAQSMVGDRAAKRYR